MRKWIIIIVVALAVPGAASAGVREDWLTVADSVALAGQDLAATQIREAVGTLSDAELQRVYQGADLAGLARVFRENTRALDALDDIMSATARNTQEALSPGFPSAVGYPSAFLCPFSPDRSNADAFIIAVDAVQASRIELEAAKVIWSGLSRVCEETVVVLGEGGNTSLACIPADIVLFAAELVVGTSQGVVEHLGFCDGAIDAAEIEGGYERVGHIHSDLEKHDGDIKVQLATHDADIKMLLGSIQETVDENQRLIKIFMGRQLETMRLLITPSGRRKVDEAVLACTGDDCPKYPAFQLCPNGSLMWNCTGSAEIRKRPTPRR